MAIKTIHIVLLICAVLSAHAVQKQIKRRNYFKNKDFNGKHHPKDPVKLQKLYEKYPQLVSEKTNPCVRHYGAQLMNLTQYPYDLMGMYSTGMVNDLGSY